MTKKVETFGEFPPEKGSADEETKRVECLEKSQEIDEQSSGVKKEDWNRTAESLQKLDERERQIYFNRARQSGDKRPKNEIFSELEELNYKINDYQEKKKKDGTYTDPWETTVDYMRKNIPSYATYLGKRQKEDKDVIPWNVYLEWLDGKDFNAK